MPQNDRIYTETEDRHPSRTYYFATLSLSDTNTRAWRTRKKNHVKDLIRDYEPPETGTRIDGLTVIFDMEGVEGTCFGTPGNYQETLKKYIDDEYLPMCYGGTLIDPDICQGGTVSEEYYTLNTDYIDRMENATIPKGDKLSKEYIVDVPGSALRWEFMTQNHDIEFGVFFKQDSKKEAVISCQKLIVIRLQKTDS
ncbi:unnamed protein product [Mytilus edulis]|uniref:Uncharacterized protein n=1 Tax=Mytilus edulis TaxID=6550 RepID=A0A8S3QMY4_MYTED|nr:unnamed protein product [Mytilus edulis]